MGYWTNDPWVWSDCPVVGGCSVVEDNTAPGFRVLVNCGTDPGSPWTADIFTEHSWFFDIYEAETCGAIEGDYTSIVVELTFGGAPTWTPENVYFSTAFFDLHRLKGFVTNLSWDGVADVVSRWEQGRVAFNEGFDIEFRKRLVLDLQR